jgi:hypothetical protein
VESAASATEAQSIVGTTQTARTRPAERSAKSGTESEQVSHNGTQAARIRSTEGASPELVKEAESETAVAPPGEHPSISAVRNAMLAEGLDPDSVRMTYHEVDVWLPGGGGWVNEMLLIETSDGRSLDFSARLTERSPAVTVCDVRHMIEGTGGWATLS